jgi:peptidoglycan/xylan/chitin deacetylase (PgdA/CDA1 family)
MAQPGIVFLMYHELELPGRPLCHSEPGYVRYVVREEIFTSQMNWLRTNHWRGLSVDEALTPRSENSVAITFDDGCETDLIAAAPILKQDGFNATFYITAGFLGRTGYMSISQLRQLHALGFEIGCHSLTHVYLDDLDDAGLRREIVDAKKNLEDIIGVKVDHFSCPGGRYDGRTSGMAREAGYRSLATSRLTRNSPSANPYLLGRVAILRGPDERGLDESAFERICTAEALPRMRFAESFRSSAKKIMGNHLYDRIRTVWLNRK